MSHAARQGLIRAIGELDQILFDLGPMSDLRQSCTAARLACVAALADAKGNVRDRAITATEAISHLSALSHGQAAKVPPEACKVPSCASEKATKEPVVKRRKGKEKA